MVKIFLMRHGQTDYNFQHLIQGFSDIKLNETGRNQARECVGKFEDLKFDRIYSSTLLRAIETAEIATGVTNDEIIKIKDLSEQNFGDREGTSCIEESSWEIRKNPPNGETIEDFKKRVIKAYYDVVEKSSDMSCILIVTHGGVIEILLSELRNISHTEAFKLKIENCQVFEIEQ